MATTISNGTDTLTATVMDGYEATREARNVVHEILGSNVPAVSLRAARTRSGTFRFMFVDAAVAQAALNMLGSASKITLADTDRPGVGMIFVAAGSVSIELEDSTRNLWVIECDYRETT